jgi:glycosyltransferase involved in cell wall biosynthesis
MAQLFEQSSLVVLPYTFFAAQSGVLHDAIAHRLPVVSTDVGALGNSVRHWGIGRVVPPSDDAALAGAIREMLTQRCYTEASEAIDRARNELSWNRAAENTIEGYSSVWRGGAKSRS